MRSARSARGARSARSARRARRARSAEDGRAAQRLAGGGALALARVRRSPGGANYHVLGKSTDRYIYMYIMRKKKNRFGRIFQRQFFFFFEGMKFAENRANVIRFFIRGLEKKSTFQFLQENTESSKNSQSQVFKPESSLQHVI